MEMKIEALHWHMEDEMRQYMEKKLEKLNFAEGSLMHCILSITRKHHIYEFEGRLHFRWKGNAVLKENGYDMRSTFDILLEKIIAKTKKEIEKIRKRS